MRASSSEKRERLDEVVVGAQFQPLDPVGHLVAGAQEQNRRLAQLPDAAQHIPAVDAGQHHVEQDQVVLPGGGQVQALDAVSGHIDHVGMFGQTLAHVGGSLGFVFDDQDSHGRMGRDGFRC